MSLPEIIRTERLELRPFSPSDAPAVFAYSSDPEWAKYQQTIPASERDAERIVARLILRDPEDEPAWAITRDGVVVGIVTLAFTAGHRIAQLGYGIGADHRRLGLTGEAIRAVLAAALAGYEQLARVAASTDARNLASIRLLEKLGFTREGVLRSGGVTASGELSDGVIYALLRSEWHVP
jgi:RimJ/RimL family protein N-acetyltransferase